MKTALLSDLRGRRWIAAVTLLAVLLGALPSAARSAFAPPASADGERWLVAADEVQPAKIETGAEPRGDRNAATPAPTPPATLATLTARRLAFARAAHAAAPSHEAAPPAAAHQRPSPTGPPLAG